MFPKKALMIAVLSVLLLSESIAEATTINSHQLEIDLKSDGSAHIVAKVDYGELTSTDAPYIVFGNSRNFAARDSAGALLCTNTPQSYGMYYLCKPNTKDKKNYSVTFEFDVLYLVSKTAQSYTFSYIHGASEPTNNLEVLLLLPEGTGIVKNTLVQPYNPDAQVGSTGRRVILKWSIKPVELGKTYIFTANYEQVGQIINYYGNYSRLLAILFALAFVFVVFRYKVFNRGAGIRSVMDVLKEDERRVMEIIIASGDKCKQKTIVQGTNFSKAKVSRIISDLEARGVIKRIRIGRTNKIVLADKKKDEPKEAAELTGPSSSLSSIGAGAEIVQEGEE